MALPAPKPNDYGPDVVPRSSAAATLDTVDELALEVLYANLEKLRDLEARMRFADAGPFMRGLDAALVTIYRRLARPTVRLTPVPAPNRCESPVCPAEHDVHGRHRTAGAS